MRSCLQKCRNAIQLLYAGQKGQAITEYSIMLVLFVGVTFMMVTLLRVFSSYGWRILNLIGSDYP